MQNKTKFFLYIAYSFMGIAVHEFSHQLFCQLVGVKVFKVKYLQFKKPAGYVEHAQPKNFVQAFFISIGPLLFGTTLSVAIFYFVVSTITTAITNGQISTSNFIIVVLAIWMAISISLHCFPSSGDAKILLSEARHHVLQRFNPFALLLFPFVWIIQLANYLKRFYFDWIYTVFLIFVSIWIYFLLKNW